MTTFRVTQFNDLDSLSLLWQEQTAQVARDAAFQREAWLAAMAAHLEDSHMLLYTACNAHRQPIGCAIAWLAVVGMVPGITMPTGVIADLILDMHHPHPGAASGLVEAVHAGFAARGIYRIIALSHPRAIVSQAFWRGRGGAGALDGFVSSSAHGQHQETP